MLGLHCSSSFRLLDCILYQASFALGGMYVLYTFCYTTILKLPFTVLELVCPSCKVVIAEFAGIHRLVHIVFQVLVCGKM